VLAPWLAEIRGQPVIVGNRPGAGATIGMDALTKAPPDGCTIGIITLTHAIDATPFPKAPYSPLRDIAPASISVHSPMRVVTHPSVPATTLGDLTALARTRTLGAPSSGNGSPPHVGLELYWQLGGFQAVHVTCKGGAPSMIDLAGGQTDFAVSSLVESIQHVKAGRRCPMRSSARAVRPRTPASRSTSRRRRRRCR
jgi:tripartite-type tricarboxylate transporter receptor subunit TctC